MDDHGTAHQLQQMFERVWAGLLAITLGLIVWVGKRVVNRADTHSANIHRQAERLAVVEDSVKGLEEHRDRVDEFMSYVREEVGGNRADHASIRDVLHEIREALRERC